MRSLTIPHLLSRSRNLTPKHARPRIQTIALLFNLIHQLSQPRSFTQTLALSLTLTLKLSLSLFDSLFPLPLLFSLNWLTCSLLAAWAEVLASILLKVPRGEGGTPVDGEAELPEEEGAFVCAFDPLKTIERSQKR